MGDEPPKPKRHLTQKYNMKAIHALTDMEEEFLTTLAGLYGCEEDDLPITLDLLSIYNEPVAKRGDHMREILKDCPKDASDLINATVQKMDQIDSETKSSV